MPPMSAKIETELIHLDYLEIQIFAMLEILGVDPSEWKAYMAFAKKVYHTYMGFWFDTAIDESEVLVDEFVLRGKDRDVLEALALIAIEKAALARGLEPPPCSHPDFVCWFHNCDTFEDWNIHGQHDFTLITTDKKECRKSIRIISPNQALPFNGDWVSWLPIPSQCDNYWGYWIKAPMTNAGGAHARIGWFESLAIGDDYAFVNWTWTALFGYRYSFSVRVAGVNLSSGWFAFVPTTWYWVEIRKTGTSFFLFVNGVQKSTLIFVAAAQPMTTFQVRHVNGGWMGMVYLDYVRIADRYEYPPT